MANSAKSPPRGRAGGGFLLGVFVGLVLGLGIAVGVAYYLNRTPLPFLSKTKPATQEDGGPGMVLPPVSGLAPGGAPNVPGQTPEKPRFDFYKILPGSEEAVTERELKDATRNAKGRAGAAGDVYYIQTGSFQNPAEADSQKARLAILGFESSVEPTNSPDKGTWYRVRLGPYSRVEELNRVRQALAQNGISASLIRLKDTRTN
jgi:hypothetical protein